MNTTHDAHKVAAHNRLSYQTHVVLRLGQYMLAAGASAYRVQDGMEKLAKAVGIEKLHVQMTYTSITATAWANGTFRTETVEQRNLGVNADKIDHFNHYVQSLPASIMAEHAEKDIEAINKRELLYSIPISSIASGVACAGFTFLNQGGWVECLAVLFAAAVGQCARRQLLKRHFNHFLVWMLCGFVASGIYSAIVASLFHANVVDATHEAGMVCAVLFLVPGFPLVTSILDLIRQDFIPGLSRAAYVVMLLISTAASVWSFSGLAHQAIFDVHPGYHLAFGWLTCGRLIATFVAAYGFAMLFNAPHQAALIAAFNGALINTGRLIARDLGFSPIAAVGVAAMAAGIIAHVMSKCTRHSRVTLSVPAVVVMIPGVPLYRAMSAMSTGQNVTEAINSTLTLLLTITAIGVGLAMARMLTDRNWRVEELPKIPQLDASRESIPEHLLGR